ncbi:MAG: NuA4-domain-containing protein, partial [Piptocephalis tieghemiana]
QTLRDAEQEVHDLLKRKKQVDKNLSALEVSIYNYEGGYLEDTRMAGGNIVRGFDGFLQGSSGRASRSGLDSMSIMSPTGGRSGGSSRSSAVLHDRDRIFSHSSMTYAKVCDLLI